MQFKNFIFISVFAGLIAFSFGTRLLGRNSVFAPENSVKKDGEKLDDKMEQRLLATKNLKFKNPKGKIIKQNFMSFLIKNSLC